MDIVEYAERICGIPLKDYQKDLLRAYCDKDKDTVYRNLLRNMSMTRYNYRGPKDRCLFCEYDTSPYKDAPSECKNCLDFDNFKRKKRMHPRQMYEYKQYIRRIGELREAKDNKTDI